MGRITINFGNIIEEMKNKQVKLCLIYKRSGWFIIDKQNRLYEIETYYYGGYLDRYIRKKLYIDFEPVPISVSRNIEEWEKDIWDVEKVKKFIKGQHLDSK